MVHIYLVSTIVHICFIYFYLAFRINDNDSTTTYNINSTTTWLCSMHVVPIRASSPHLIEHRLSTWFEWSSIQQGIKPSTYIYEWLYIQQGIKPSTLYEWFTFNKASSPQLNMNDFTFNRASSPQLYEYAWTQQLNQQQRTTSTNWQQ